MGAPKLLEKYLFAVRVGGLRTAKTVDFSTPPAVYLPSNTIVGATVTYPNGVLTAVGGTTIGTGGGGSAFTTDLTVTEASATALQVGLSLTNPAFNVDTSTALSATGLNIKSAAAAGGLAISVISSGTNENLTIDAKGSGTISIGSVSTGKTTITQGLIVSSASTQAVAFGRTGATNPGFSLNANTAGAVTGIQIMQAAAAGGLAITTTSTGTNESMTIDAKGSGNIGLNTVASGTITLGGTTNFVSFGQNAIAVGGGASATLSTIGGSGPATAAQNAWLRVNIGGTASYIPFWR